MRLVVFSATWCGPCQRYKPVLAAFTAMTDIRVHRIDVDESPETKEAYGVKTVPTTVLEDENGVEIARAVGVQTVTDLYELTNQHHP